MKAVVIGTPERADALVSALERDGITTSVTTQPVPEDVADLDVVVVMTDDSRTASADVSRIREVTQSAPIVLILPALPPDARRILGLGANGILLESDVAVAAAATIRTVAAGQLVMPVGVRDMELVRPLSTREKQVLALLVLGCANAEIAERLYLTESTVKSHLASAYKKLGVTSRNAAVALILERLGTGVLSITDGERIEARLPET